MKIVPPGRGPVTLRDVAEHARVSIATASNALTGARRVGPDSVERVLRSAAELGYRPNGVARSLRTGLHRSIGLVIPDVTNPFWAGMVSVIEGLADESGFQLSLVNTGFDAGRESASLTRLAGAVDGVLLFSTNPRATMLAPALAGGLPIVAVDEGFELEGVGGVYSDNAGGGRLAAEHLVDAGGTVFGLLAGPASLTTAAQRSAGFAAGLAGRGVDPSRLHRVTAPYSFEGGREGVRRMLARHPEVDALFACTDNQAIGATFEAHDLGRVVPDDLLVCGFDDISWASRITPTLTTLRQDSAGMARRAFVQLVELVTHGGEPEVTVFPVTLVERASTRRVTTV
ncbi:LacI family DNA-binding transcriptional regulator [Herbiconiux sp. VKM Ac-2851]|uniref:LacI family DNA-binding transcriptional regulator n=1 Tax=Herbiconiux sp. VKM Ac-2851 TaxID=2739025 RepID=UPI0015637B6D|nr:LacI family DNA-binding transcriptional regulator [Herbiconiux sp. VKM Ac-2851]NQX33466.1 LacI family DNA-binding transcriptional regulator [Herbiconiux sp. VKM Ac-2851]